MDSTFFGESTGLYFCSAVFQGNMALLAVVGAFVIFRTQSLEALVDSENRACLDYVRNVFQTRHGVPYPLNLRAVTFDGIEAALEQLANEGTAPAAIRKTASEIIGTELFYSFRRSQDGLARVFKAFNASWRNPLRYIVAIVILSLVLMLLTTAIHNLTSSYFEALVFSMIALLQYVTIRSSIQMVKSMF